MPGPASTEGDRPPTNSAIQVRSPLPQVFCGSKHLSFQTREICLTQKFDGNFRHTDMSINHATSKKGISAICWGKKRSSSLHCMKGNVAWTNRPYDVIWQMWRHIHISYYAILFYNDTSNLRRYPTRLSLRLEPTEMTEQQCLRPRERWNMRPTG